MTSEQPRCAEFLKREHVAHDRRHLVAEQQHRCPPDMPPCPDCQEREDADTEFEDRKLNP